MPAHLENSAVATGLEKVSFKEQGTHDELLKKNGIYRSLYETQFRRAIDYEQEHGSPDDDDDELDG